MRKLRRMIGFGGAAVLSAMFLIFPAEVGKAVTDTLRVCAFTLIPALFPMMAVCNLLTSLGIGEAVGKVFGKPFSKLTGTGGGGAAAFLIGAVCGYPGGASAACRLCDADDAAQALCFCNNCGIAFCVSGIGTLHGDPAVGWKVWAAQIIAALITRFILRPKSVGKAPKSVPFRTVSDGKTTVSEAIRSASLTMLTVCGTVTFFSAVSAVTGIFTAGLPVPVRCLTAAFPELTGGVREAVALLPARQAAIFCAFTAGWGGMCVHLQTAAVADGVKMRKYYLGKVLTAVLSAAVAAVIL